MAHAPSYTAGRLPVRPTPPEAVMHAPPFARALCLVGLAGLLLAPPARGGDLDANKLGAVRARMQSFVDQGDVAGAVTVVGTRGGVAGVEAVGLMNIEKNQPT